MIFFSGIIFFCLCLSAYVTWRFNHSFHTSIRNAPRLAPVPPSSQLPTLAVVIPAYNEEINLRACVEAVLSSQLPQPDHLQIWIADDESTDQTGTIARQLVAQDSRVHLVAVSARPTEKIWRGKNWACDQAVIQAQGEYLLFIDADVRLEPDAIATALTIAQSQQTDLLSCLPEVICGCLAEWLAQPLIIRILTAGFDISSVNDPTQDIAFAAGPFMLFRRAAYDKIGGHRAVADDLVEDVALARQIKAAGLKMYLCLGLGFVKVRMYQNLAGLWEGWTKNLHMGAGRKINSTLLVAVIAFFGQTMTWLGLLLASIDTLLTWPGTVWPGVGWLALVLLVWQLWLWFDQAAQIKIPGRYWWLSWLGGLLVAAIALGSVIKTETGWGWTWRGRSLVVPSSGKF